MCEYIKIAVSAIVFILIIDLVLVTVRVLLEQNNIDTQIEQYKAGNVIPVEGDIFIGTDNDTYIYITKTGKCYRVNI